jgi:hypothetical protein
MRSSYEPSIFAMNTESKPAKSEHQEKARSTQKPVRSQEPVPRRTAMVNLGEVRVGDVAPDFELEDTLFMKHRLSSYRGRKILLSFLRFAA